MTESLDARPLQPELPFDNPPAPARPVTAPEPEEAAHVVRLPGVPEDLPPPISEQIWSRLRGLPWWTLWSVLGRGVRYSLKLGQAMLRYGLIRDLAHRLASAVHLAGLPAVVLRTAIQLTLAHRAGLTIEETVYFRLGDPAGYVVYEAPARMGTAAAIAFVPTLVLTVLAVICLGPAVGPRAVLHLPTTWLTWVQLWLGLSFATHALPAHEEAGPLAEQARSGVRQADPVSLLWALPAHAVALITRPGGLLPAALGAAAIVWVANAVFPA